jgi:hypothetical protein
MTDSNNIKVLSFYANKIHNNPEFYELEKKRVVKYQVQRYNNDDEYKEKKKEYCRMKMQELYNKRKLQRQAQSPINQD